jgi:hypothetical protein
MFRRASTIAILMAALTGCSSPTPDAAPAADPAPVAAVGSLTAEVSPGPRPNTVVVLYRNGTAQEAIISEQVLITPCLALEVTDRDGRVLPPVPPSPRWPKDEGVRIPAGGTRQVEYSLHMFSQPLPPGLYQVRVRIKGWASEPLEYAVLAEG